MQSDVVYWLEKEFGVHHHHETWRSVPGIYIFAGLVKDRRGNSAWRPYYVGQTSNLADRIPNHERWIEAKRKGATHVHARVETNNYLRFMIEKELIQQYKPLLNDLIL